MSLMSAIPLSTRTKAKASGKAGAIAGKGAGKTLAYVAKAGTLYGRLAAPYAFRGGPLRFAGSARRRAAKRRRGLKALALAARVGYRAGRLGSPATLLGARASKLGLKAGGRGVGAGAKLGALAGKRRRPHVEVKVPGNAIGKAIAPLRDTLQEGLEEQRPARGRRYLAASVAGAGAGAGAVYFLDPHNGRRRRHIARDRVRKAAQRQRRQAERKARYAEGVAAGRKHEQEQREHPHHAIALDDTTLAQKVETEIFRPADAPKGSVDVNAENGVIYLRGQASQGWIEQLIASARGVQGVKEVKSLLHEAGEPARTAESARGADGKGTP